MRFLFLLACFCCSALAQTGKKSADLVEWKPIFPPYVHPSGYARRPFDMQLRTLPRLMVPLGTTNVARGKKVTTSDALPFIGQHSLITNGVKDAIEGSWVEYGPGLQWVQIDLAKPCHIYGVHIWHYWTDGRFYQDVVVQIADNEAFTKNVQTLFNNDQDNSSGFGHGRHSDYIEKRLGFLIDTRGPKNKGQTARYVRLYSRGNTIDHQNQYIEVEVVGQKVESPPITNINSPPRPR